MDSIINTTTLEVHKRFLTLIINKKLEIKNEAFKKYEQEFTKYAKHEIERMNEDYEHVEVIEDFGDVNCRIMHWYFLKEFLESLIRNNYPEDVIYYIKNCLFCLEMSVKFIR